MTCPSCAYQNPAGSVFCQHCGTRLQSPQPAAAPVAAQGTVTCSRCGSQQSTRMRFCTECGNSLDAPSAQAPHAPQAAQAAPSPQARAAPAQPNPRGAGAQPNQQGVAAQISGAIGGPLCWRCRGVGDAGSEFCKFCGARYSDGTSNGAHAASSAQGQPGPQAARPAQPTPGAQRPQSFGSPGTSGSRLVSILKDGSDGQAYDLPGEQDDIGRSEGAIRLPDDPYLSPRHARVRRDGDRYFLRDLDSENGVYLRLREPVELKDGDRILIGQQVLRFEILADSELPLGPASVRGVLVFGTPEVPRFARLVQYTTEGVGRDYHYLYRDETVLGRENGDVVFTDDPFLSRRHASISIDRVTKRCVLKDVGSSNGTSIRIRGEHELSHGDHFRIGRHLFRFDAGGAR